MGGVKFIAKNIAWLGVFVFMMFVLFWIIEKRIDGEFSWLKAQFIEMVSSTHAGDYEPLTNWILSGLGICIVMYIYIKWRDYSLEKIERFFSSVFLGDDWDPEAKKFRESQKLRKKQISDGTYKETAVDQLIRDNRKDSENKSLIHRYRRHQQAKHAAEMKRPEQTNSINTDKDNDPTST